MRDHLVLYVNGARREVRARDAFLSLADYLRQRLGLVGTKIVCSEGDCGACTVLVGRPNEARDALVYLPIDACIQFLFQLDGTHIVTVEGLRSDGSGLLNGVQQAMVDCHGSQCGFCTPGFVMAMTGMLEADNPAANGHGEFDLHHWRRGFTGNLCRCTGYTPILDAAARACEAEHRPLDELYPPATMLADFAASADDEIELAAESSITGEQFRAFCPTTLVGALDDLAAHPDARIIAGATDVGVRVNKSGRLPATTLDLNRVAELDFVRVENGVLHAGARATWTALLDACGLAIPEFARILEVFGAPQIRHVGTLGGNIANGSPIADALPFLFIMDATLTLASARARREVNINNFYHGYKQLDLQPGELITDVTIPLPTSDEHVRLYKISRRRDLDIATFTAAIRLRLSAETIEHASIALGGVGPTVLRATQAEQFLIGQPFTEQTMQTAGDLAANEITPITDVRGAADYRRQLTRNVFLKFYHQARPWSVVSGQLHEDYPATDHGPRTTDH